MIFLRNRSVTFNVKIEKGGTNFPEVFGGHRVLNYGTCQKCCFGSPANKILSGNKSRNFDLTGRKKQFSGGLTIRLAPSMVEGLAHGGLAAAATFAWFARRCDMGLVCTPLRHGSCLAVWGRKKRDSLMGKQVRPPTNIALKPTMNRTCKLTIKRQPEPPNTPKTPKGELSMVSPELLVVFLDALAPWREEKVARKLHLVGLEMEIQTTGSLVVYRYVNPWRTSRSELRNLSELVSLSVCLSGTCLAA